MFRGIWMRRGQVPDLLGYTGGQGKNMAYTHFVFDIDGTLIDTERALMRALQRMLEAVQGRKYKLESLRSLFGMTAGATLDSLGVKDVGRAAALWKEQYLADTSGVHIFPGMEAVLQALHLRPVRLGILSSKTRHEYGTDFVPFGLVGYFETAVLVEDSTRHKPDPEPMKVYLRRTGARAAEVLYIGDTLFDSQCASGAGVDFALAGWGSRSGREIGATYYLSEPGEILELAPKAW